MVVSSFLKLSIFSSENPTIHILPGLGYTHSLNIVMILMTYFTFSGE